MASSLFEMGYETEMENEQFEAAKQVVQLATKAAQIAQSAPPNVPPQVVAQHAVAEAAKDLGIHPQAAQPAAHDLGNGGGYGYGQQQAPAAAAADHRAGRHRRTSSRTTAARAAARPARGNATATESSSTAHEERSGRPMNTRALRAGYLDQEVGALADAARAA